MKHKVWSLCNAKIPISAYKTEVDFSVIWLVTFQFDLLGVLAKIFRTTGFQLKLLRSIESLNIFHWKPAEKIKVGVVLWQNLDQIRPNVVKKVKKQV